MGPADCKRIDETRAVGSSIDLVVPTIAPLVDEWYRSTPAAIEGMPPHLPLLWPWLPAPLADGAVERATQAVAGVERFTLVLRDTARFPGVLYLAPEPRAPLDDLIARLGAAFPETPPYGGQFGPAPVPHLTVAMSADEAALDAVERALRPALSRPHIVDVDRVSISESGPDGRWSVRSAVRLAG